MVPQVPGEAGPSGRGEASGRLPVEVCYALPDRQRRVQLTLEPGTTVEQAIRASGLLSEFPDIDLARNAVGIDGQRVELGTLLAALDRVEIYRPLKRDPKDRRRKHAGQQKAVRP